MGNVIEIDNTLYKALADSFGQDILKEKINTFLISALDAQLEKFSRGILKFEKMWDEGKIENKHSHEIEGDFMDWEMMEMEKKDLLTALSKLQEYKNAASSL